MPTPRSLEVKANWVWAPDETGATVNSARHFLAAKQIADVLDRLKLEIEVGFEMEFHVLAVQ